MIIRWASHVAAFVRRQNFAIQGQNLLNNVISTLSVIPVTPDLPMSTGYTIDIGPQDRVINIPVENREINIPNDRRRTNIH